MANIEVAQVEPMDREVLEEWVRVTYEEDILGVCATRSADSKWPWRVSIRVAKYIRVEPLQTELHASITNALNRISGVTQATQEDREVWMVQGDVSGRELVRASAIALDSLAEAMRAAFAAL